MKTSIKEDSRQDLYTAYRESLTKKIAKITESGESFKVAGISGVGKSKYLRYLSSSKEIEQQFFQNHKVKFIYIDLNKTVDRTSEDIIHIISSASGQEVSKLSEIEIQINEALKNYEKIYLIFDHSEIFAEFEERAIRLLRGLRDEFKYKLAYIFAYEIKPEETHAIKHYLFEIAPIELKMDPLSRKESIVDIRFLASKMGLKLSDKEIDLIAEKADGMPRNTKQILSQISVGSNLEKAINDVMRAAPVIKEAKSIDPENILDYTLKYMTKNEFIVFKLLFENLGKVIHRDEFAKLLNPQTEGDGVSNESIDQLLSRIRKALKGMNLSYTIKTKRGVGYYLE